MYEHLLLETQGQIAILKINNPHESYRRRQAGRGLPPVPVSIRKEMNDMYEHLLLETQGQIAILKINNPKSLNALKDCLRFPSPSERK